MLIQQNNLSVSRSQDFAEKDFTIKASAKAFQILSSGLYENKIRAIIRELSTNAYDAHIVARTESTPFVVHLPNQLEPFFSIRDFGTGLSEQKVREVYTTYFASDKTESNELVGCLGLGSKSPFSYTDNFTVTSYFEGVKYSYAAFIGESGVPVIALLDKEQTTEANGLEISLAVMSSDFHSFQWEASNVYRWFKSVPSILGATLDTYGWNSKPLMSGSNWKMNGKNTPSVVVMGNVCYPLGSIPGATSSIVELLSYGLVLDFDLGELDVSASRESLSLDKRTVANLLARLEQILSHLEDTVAKSVEGASSLWEAMLGLDSFLHGDMSLFRNVFKNGVCPLYKGNVIALKLCLDEPFECFSREYTRRGENRYRPRANYYKEIDLRGSHIILVHKDTTARGHRGALRAFCTEEMNKREACIVVVDTAQRAQLQDVYEVPDTAFVSLDSLIEKFRTTAVVRKSALNRPKDLASSLEGWVEISLEEAEGCYVKSNRRGEPAVNKYNTNLREKVNTLVAASGYDCPKVYFLTEQEIEKIDPSKMIELSVWMNDCIQEILKNPDYTSELEAVINQHQESNNRSNKKFFYEEKRVSQVCETFIKKYGNTGNLICQWYEQQNQPRRKEIPKTTMVNFFYKCFAHDQRISLIETLAKNKKPELHIKDVCEKYRILPLAWMSGYVTQYSEYPADVVDYIIDVIKMSDDAEKARSS